MTDCVTDANIMQVVACYDNMQVLNALMPEFYDLQWLMKTTDTKGLMYGK